MRQCNNTLSSSFTIVSVSRLKEANPTLETQQNEHTVAAPQTMTDAVATHTLSLASSGDGLRSFTVRGLLSVVLIQIALWALVGVS